MDIQHQNGPMNDDLSTFYDEPKNVPKVRFLRAYCGSHICSCSVDGIKLKIKADVWLNKPRNSPSNSVYDKLPIDCPDCNSVLFWERIRHGSIHDPIF